MRPARSSGAAGCMDETLDLLQRAWAGEPVAGGELRSGRRRPPASRVPVLIGGTSDAAVRRTVEYGDGWTAGGGGPDAGRADGRAGSGRLAGRRPRGRAADRRAGLLRARRRRRRRGRRCGTTTASSASGPSRIVESARAHAGAGAATRSRRSPTPASPSWSSTRPWRRGRGRPAGRRGPLTCGRTVMRPWTRPGRRPRGRLPEVPSGGRSYPPVDSGILRTEEEP